MVFSWSKLRPHHRESLYENAGNEEPQEVSVMKVRSHLSQNQSNLYFSFYIHLIQI